MKKLIALLLAASLAGALFAAPATAGKRKKGKKGTKQEYVGTIMLPAPYPTDNTCYSRGERMIALAGVEQASGYVGSHFDINPKTWGQKFQLHVMGGSADVDLDIIFYAAYGDPADPTAVPAYVAYETREPGGEAATVPEGMEKAIVCMAAGQDAEFHYISK